MSERPNYIRRSTLGIASAILVITSFLGMIFVPPGIIIGPVIDKFITPHLLAKRGYESPGAPLWSVAVGGLSFLPALAAGAATTPSGRDQALLFALVSGLGAVVLGVAALRGPLRRMCIIGIGLGLGAAVFAVVVHASAA